MNERYIQLKIEFIVNKLLYKKNIIEKTLYEETSRKLDELLFEENKKIVAKRKQSFRAIISTCFA